MGVLNWSLTAARNAIVDPVIRALDGASARDYPGLVRGVMAGARALADDQGGAIQTGGTANAYTATTASGISDLRPGLRILLRVDRDNTDAVTLNVDGTGPKPWLSAAGLALAVGALRKGRFVAVTYAADLDAWLSDAGAAFTNGDFQAVPALTLKGNAGATAGSPADLAVDTVRALLHLDLVDNTSDLTKSKTGNPVGDAIATRATPGDIANAVAGFDGRIASLAAAVTAGSVPYAVQALAEEVEERAALADQATATVDTARQRDALVSRAEVVERVAALARAPAEPPRFVYQSTNDHKTDGRAFPVGRRKILFVPVMGQSLAVRGVTGNAISTTPLSPLRGLMPASGLHISDTRSPDWIPLREGLVTASDTITNESVATSFVAHLNAIIDGISGTATPDDKPIFATAICAIGSRNYWQLKEGSQAFRWFTNALTDLVEWADARGYDVECPGLLWIQGENDVYFTNGYDAMLHQLQRTIARAARAITGQREEPIVFFNQVNRVLAVQAQTGQRLPAAQLMAQHVNPRLRCVGPIYACEMGDMVHKSSRGAYSMGMLFARGVAAELFGQSEFAAGCRPLMPKVGLDGFDVAFISATQIRINCHVPVEPMVIDTSGAIISTGAASYNDGAATWTTAGIASTLGFTVYNPDGSTNPIASVTLISGSTTVFDPPSLLLTLASAPAVPWVRVSYAENRDAVKGGPSNYTNPTLDDASPDGPKMGARGCIRDSAAHAALYDGALEYNWMVSWSRRVPAWSVNPGTFTA